MLIFPRNISPIRKPATSEGAKGNLSLSGLRFFKIILTGICITDPIIKPNIMKVYPNHPPSKDKANISLKSPEPKPPLLIRAVTIRTNPTSRKATIAEAITGIELYAKTILKLIRNTAQQGSFGIFIEITSVYKTTMINHKEEAEDTARKILFNNRKTVKPKILGMAILIPVANNDKLSPSIFLFFHLGIQKKRVTISRIKVTRKGILNPKMLSNI